MATNSNPNDTAHEQLRRHSLTLLRQTSQTFTGGAAPSSAQATAPPTAPSSGTTDVYQPIRQPSQRHIESESQDDVQRRLVEEATAFVTDNFKAIIVVVIILVVMFFTILILFVRAAAAAIWSGEKPCDMPLKYYVCVVIMWGQLPGILVEYTARCLNIQEGDVRKFFISLFFSLPGWGLLGWGVWMVQNSKTCAQTNPYLFYNTRNYIYGQVCIAFFIFLFGIFAAMGMRRFLLYMNTLIVNPGCVQAVHKLPRVAPGSRELVDEEDGEVKACTICLMPLGESDNLQRSNSTLSVKPSDIVRTPCNHFFHEDCLVNWCTNHIDCPLCREPVGEPDPKEGDLESGPLTT